jgi:hypothetical protein
MTKTLRPVAYHEAAHAVASFRAGGFPAVSIVPTVEALGAVKPHGLEDVDDRTFVRVCLAGPAIDLERGLPDVRANAWADFDVAAPFILRNQWDEAVLLAETRTWVRSEIEAITAVAERLLIDHSLNEQEIAIIVGDADGELEGPLDIMLQVARQKGGA